VRRKRFQRGSLVTRKRNGKNYWLGQWREKGGHRTRELGLCSEIGKIAAESMLQGILKPINEGVERKESANNTFEQFVEHVYLPVYERKWKASTADTEIPRIRYHLVGRFGDQFLRSIKRKGLQDFLDDTGKRCGRSVVDHLRFRLRSIFALAVSEGAMDRNPATELFTPRKTKPGRQRKLLTPEDSGKIVEVLEFREQLIARLATWEGMRPGEILALQLGDVEEDCVWVRRRLYKGDLDVPKTERSERQVALSYWDKGATGDVDRAVVSDRGERLAVSVRKRQAVTPRQRLESLHAAEAEAGWLGVGYVPGYAADICHLVEKGGR
jgi:integrase